MELSTKGIVTNTQLLKVIKGFKYESNHSSQSGLESSMKMTVSHLCKHCRYGFGKDLDGGYPYARKIRKLVGVSALVPTVRR